MKKLSKRIQDRLLDIFILVKNASLKKKLGIAALVAALSWFVISRVLASGQIQPQYQTGRVEKGTLVESVTVSGTVLATNQAPVTTQASGVVKELLVGNGDYIEGGKPIAKIMLDQASLQKQAAAWSSYLQAKTSLDAANASAYSLQSDMFSKWKTYKDLVESSSYDSPEERVLAQFHIAEKDWLAAEAKYKNQQAVIQQTQAAVNSNWLAYLQLSDSVIAPISGKVYDLSVQTGTVLSSSSLNTAATQTATSQKIAIIRTDSSPIITVNLTEVDAPKVQVGNKATITLDAFPGKTMTGQVISIDTAGQIASGVATYPAKITLDSPLDNMYPNMSATAAIITNTKSNVLLVPLAAVQTQQGESVVKIMRNKQIEEIPVETGLSNDTSIEIISGLSEGDVVVTGATGTGTSPQSTTTSPFSGFRPGGFGPRGR